ncbi:hypothetical protein RvY_03507-2 [Ramazzottius varieornatus]|uniref:Sulfatase N-terminal domain-containing protein n=1 Tax=Ramazzottius varieornatus TaxID=947166 RepID=A0A1D1UXN6_RAMVA|nr:hypothetical protein RvY_03507-2 [Ramazzottius varieornatus]
MPQYLQRPPIQKLSAKFTERRKQLAQIQALDEQVKHIVDALRNKGILDNTIIAFMSDNGAADASHYDIDPGLQRGVIHGSNWPMRHSKSHDFEGGVRTPSFIWSPLIKRSGRVYNDLFHLIDWLPTLYEAACGSWVSQSPDPYREGSVSQGKAINEGIPQGKGAPRNDLVVELTPNGRRAFISNQLDRQGNVLNMWKFIKGPTWTKKFLGWTRTEGTSAQDQVKLVTPASANCQKYPPGTEVGEKCNPNVAACLFELIPDPCEARNLAKEGAAFVQHLEHMINVTHAQSMIPSESRFFDPRSHPDRWNQRWVPWMDADLREDVASRVVSYAPFNPPSAF